MFHLISAWMPTHLIHTKPAYANITQFLDYYHHKYSPFGQFSSHMYSHHCNVMSRTINYLEGRHSRMKKHINAPHPNIYVFIDLLQKEQSLAPLARIRDDMGASAPKRTKKKIITDCLVKLWQRYDDGLIFQVS
ncbi:unnamed protein product [Didymodactylos carnosus]|uniref:Uncharacterized protein n=1 Tax=Didymodactylos carnosus TaxID=1234261 RepID=A0A8S2D1T8_9BILA|nr:unnamed protein product [Didymodactylos carnosus]CAF3605343.1 unnamed protein product [Didymodactylos carnosus]